jgi:hypothetical protein
LILLVIPNVASVEDRDWQIGCSVLVESPEGVLEKKVEQA